MGQRYDEDLVERFIDAGLNGPIDTFADLAKELAAQRCWTVAVCLVSSAYGGPEEGGWYYECGHPSTDEVVKLLTKTFYEEEKAEAYRVELCKFVERLNLDDGMKACRPVGGCGDDDDSYRGQVAGEGQYEVIVFAGPEAKAFPDHIPHYE